MSKSVFMPTNTVMSTEERQMWLAVQAQRLAVKFKTKYNAGVMEHECDLGSVSVEQLLTEMEHEALDQLAYVAELRRRYNIEQYNAKQS